MRTTGIVLVAVSMQGVTGPVGDGAMAFVGGLLMLRKWWV